MWRAFYDNARVLDLTRTHRRRVAARMMAQYGAEVYCPAHIEEMTDFLDAGKTPLEIDQHLSKRLADFDVIIVTEGSEERYGLSYAALTQDFPDKIIASVTAFGLTGPRAGEPTTDDMLQALSGAAFISQDIEGRPRLHALHFLDGATAAIATLAMGAALIRRLRTGQGGALDICAFDVTYQTDTVAFPGVAASKGEIPLYRYDDNRARVDTTAVFRGVNRHLLVLAFGEFWDRFAAAMDRRDLIGKPGFRDDQERCDNWDGVFEAAESWLRKLNDDDKALSLLIDARVPACFVEDARNALDHPQLAFRKFVASAASGAPRLHAPVIDTGQRVETAPIRAPVRLSSIPSASPPTRAPAPANASRRPLEGIRIADFSMMTAGGLVTRLLADLGADVWKIEPPAGELGRTIDLMMGLKDRAFLRLCGPARRAAFARDFPGRWRTLRSGRRLRLQNPLATGGRRLLLG